MTPHILILAAGSASRMFGGDKLLEPIDGQPQLTRITKAALATGCPVTVALPPDRPARNAALRDLAVAQLTVENAAEGMAASLRTGIAALPDGPVLLLLADLPEITAADLHSFLTAWAVTPDLILRGCAQDGSPGHPVGFPGWARADLLTMQGDEGAKTVLKTHAGRLRLHPLPAAHATTDLDTPEDWAAWRAARARTQ